MPARVVATLRVSGRRSESLFKAKIKELLNELDKAKIKTKGNVFTMLYNAPYIPGFLRRNKVAIEVELGQQCSRPDGLRAGNVLMRGVFPKSDSSTQ